MSLIEIKNPPTCRDEVVNRFRGWTKSAKEHDILLQMFNRASMFLPLGDAYERVLNDRYKRQAETAVRAVLTAFLLGNETR